MNLLDIGGGFPAPYDDKVNRSATWPARSTANWTGFSPRTSRSWPSRAVSSCATAGTAVAKIIGKAVRDGKLCYYIDDGVYHTFSGIIFDHCQYHLKSFKTRPDADLLGLRPDLRRAGHDFAGRGTAATCELGDLLYSENIGAYSHASST